MLFLLSIKIFTFIPTANFQIENGKVYLGMNGFRKRYTVEKKGLRFSLHFLMYVFFSKTVAVKSNSCTSAVKANSSIK